MTHRKTPAVLVMAALPLVAASASAQQNQPAPDETMFDEITVTAQRVEEAAQDVPISIVTRSGEELEQQAIHDVQALTESVPGVLVSSQTPSSGEVSVTIRGIGSSTLGLGTESTVGYYVDGVYMPRPQAFVNPFLDVERVEILRGPQGTLWGRNSTAGAINVVTRAPRGEFHGRLFGSVSELDASESAAGNRYGLSLTGPVTSKVWGRITGAGARIEDATWNEFLRTGSDNFDGMSLRGALTFLPSDSLTFTIRADSTDDDAHSNFHLKPGDVSPYSVMGTVNRFLGYADPTDVHRIAVGTAPVSPYEENGYSLNVNKTMGSGTNFTSISSWRSFDSMRVVDIDGSPAPLVVTSGQFASEWWSQEFQLHGSSDRARWVAGAYAFGEDSKSFVNTVTDPALLAIGVFANAPQFFFFDPKTFCSLGVLAPKTLCRLDYYNAVAPLLMLPRTGAPAPLPFSADLDSSVYAGYGQVDWALGDRFTLTTGARYTVDEKDHLQHTINFRTFMPSSQRLSDSWSALTPKLGIEYRPRDHVMVYGAATAGYKSGGYNSISLQPAFDEETVTSFEVGFKAEVANRKLRLGASAFHYDYDDLQVAVFYADRSVVENAAQARIRGLEFELAARPNRQFSFDLSVSVLDDEFRDYTSLDPVRLAQFSENLLKLLSRGLIDPLTIIPAILQGGGGGPLPVAPSDLSGNGLSRAPDLSATASLQYVFDWGSGGSLAARGEVQYSDDVAFNAFERFIQPAYSVLNAHLRWTSAQNGLFVALYGRNLGDEEYRVNEVFTSYTGSRSIWAPPREVGLQLGFDF